MTAAFEDGDTVYLAAERATVPAAVAEAVLAVLLVSGAPHAVSVPIIAQQSARGISDFDIIFNSSFAAETAVKIRAMINSNACSLYGVSMGNNLSVGRDVSQFLDTFELFVARRYEGAAVNEDWQNPGFRLENALANEAPCWQANRSSVA